MKLQAGDFVFDKRQLKIVQVQTFSNDPSIFVYHIGFKGILRVDKNCFKINIDDYPYHKALYERKQ